MRVRHACRLKTSTTPGELLFQHRLHTFLLKERYEDDRWKMVKFRSLTDKTRQGDIATSSSIPEATKKETNKVSSKVLILLKV